MADVTVDFIARMELLLDDGWVHSSCKMARKMVLLLSDLFDGCLPVHVLQVLAVVQKGIQQYLCNYGNVWSSYFSICRRLIQYRNG